MREFLIRLFWILYSLKGKIGRLDFLIGLVSIQVLAFLLAFCLAAPLAFLHSVFLHSTNLYIYSEWVSKENILPIIKAICYLNGFYIFTALVKKRLRDLDFSQWWTIPFVIPPINLIGIILFLSLRGVKNK